MNYLGLLLLCSSVLLITQQCQAQAQISAVKVTVSNDGAETLAENFLPSVISQVQGLTIPDLSGSQSLDGLGKIAYTVSKIRLNSISYGSVLAQVNPQVQLGVSGLTLQLTAHWSVRTSAWPHISTSGSVDISIHNAVADMFLNLGFQPIALNVEKLQLHLGSPSIKVHGSDLSVIYNWILEIASGTITSKLTSALTSKLSSEIESVSSDMISRLSFVVNVVPGIAVDFTPVYAAPTAQGFGIYLRGAFVNKSDGQPPNLPFQMIGVDLPYSNDMLDALIHDYFVNSFFYVFHNAGLLSVSFDTTEIPPSVPFKFITTTFKNVIPALYNDYPDANLRVAVCTSAAPVVTVSSSGALLQATVNLTWFANSTTNEWEQVFVLSGIVKANLVPKFSGSTISAQAQLLDLELSLASSDIGSFDVTNLSGFMNAIVSGPVISMLNQELIKGVTLPSFQGTRVTNGNVQYADHLVAAAATFEFDLPNSTVQP